MGAIQQNPIAFFSSWNSLIKEATKGSTVYSLPLNAKSHNVLAAPNPPGTKRVSNADT